MPKSVAVSMSKPDDHYIYLDVHNRHRVVGADPDGPPVIPKNCEEKNMLLHRLDLANHNICKLHDTLEASKKINHTITQEKFALEREVTDLKEKLAYLQEQLAYQKKRKIEEIFVKKHDQDGFDESDISFRARLEE